MDEYLRTENGYFFTDISAPSDPDTSFGDLNPPPPPPFTPPEPGVTTLDDGKVVKYEDDEMFMDHFVYDDNGKLVSYLETKKEDGSMILYTITRTQGPQLETVGSGNDYENFAVTGQVDSADDDVADADIENYDFTETPIAAIGPHGELIPA